MVIRYGVLILVIFTAAAMTVGVWVAGDHSMSPTEVAIGQCEVCGMDRDWVLGQIQTVRESGLTGEESVALWEKTYDDPEELAEARERCLPCVEAIVTAAGEEGS